MAQKIEDRVEILADQLERLNDRVNTGFSAAATGIDARIKRVEKLQDAADERYEKQNKAFQSHTKWLIGVLAACVIATLAAVGVVLQAFWIVSKMG